MSEEKRTRKEVEADLLIKLAEVEKANAETKKLEVEIKKLETESLQAELEYLEAHRAYNKKLLTDEENHLYRFSRDVNESSVAACRRKVTE